MRKVLVLAAAVSVGVAAVAAAASQGSVTITLSPDRPAAPSTLTVSANGPFPQASGTLTSAVLRTQKGFSASAKSVAVLCTASQEASAACPDASKIGAGTAVVTVSGSGPVGSFSRQDTLTFKLFLGVPAQPGDIAAVVISGSDSLLHQSAHATGRLFRVPGGGLELRFDQLPKYSVPPGTKVALDQLSFSAHAVRTLAGRARKRADPAVYSVITNPPRCRGRWRAQLALSFSDGSFYRSSMSTPCSGG